MDNLGENRQLINILFCGYRRSEIGDWRLMPKPILAGGTGAPASNNTITVMHCSIPTLNTALVFTLMIHGDLTPSHLERRASLLGI